MQNKPSFPDDSTQRLTDLEERLKKITPPSKPEAKLPPPLFAMCPLCGGAMEYGGVSIHGPLWGKLSGGEWHPKELWFHPASGVAEIEIVPASQPCRASRCQQCGFVGIKASPE